MEKKLRELLDLVKENPDLPVKFMTACEVVGDDYGYWMGSIEQIKKTIYTSINERLYFDEDDIKEELCETIDDSVTDEEEIEKLLDIKFKEMEKSGEIEEAIIVYINV